LDSPIQGLIRGNEQQKDCTVVLQKKETFPNTKKPDKFRIQATKVHAETAEDDLTKIVEFMFIF